MNLIDALKTGKGFRNVNFKNHCGFALPKLKIYPFTVEEVLSDDWEVETEKENPYVMDVKEILDALWRAKEATEKLLEKTREGK